MFVYAVTNHKGGVGKTTAAATLGAAFVRLGRRVLLQVDKDDAKPGEERLRVEHLTVKDKWGVARVDDVSFSVRAGEIVGIAGVSGNGQSELLECLAGLEKAKSGRIVLMGEVIDPALEADPALMRTRGLAHVLIEVRQDLISSEAGALIWAISIL